MERIVDFPNVPPDPRRSALDYKKRQYLEAVRELASRNVEALNLYEPLPFQQRIHCCTAQEALILKGNRSGGSLAVFVEAARAITGQDPHGKYPQRDGTLACLGFGEPHIGNVIHRLLFRPGAFDIIRDETTKQWRTYRPWSPDQEIDGRRGDLHRVAEVTKAPPLVPKRFIEPRSWAWISKPAYIFKSVRITTGWTVLGLNSAGDDGQCQGFDVNLFLIDEDTARANWLEEAQARVSKVGGYIRWAAMQRRRNDDMVKLIERAEMQELEKSERPTTVVFRASIFDNVYYPADRRDNMVRIWASQGEDVLRKRAYGEISNDSILMYPTFNRRLHCAAKLSEPRWPIQKYFAENRQPGNDWMRAMVVDPGGQVCAVTFWAVPPPQHFGRWLVCYKELWLENATAETFAAAVEPEVAPHIFEWFIIDMHGGRLREIGSGNLPYRLYEQSLAKRGLRCRRTQNRFVAGVSDVAVREEQFRLALGDNTDGHPLVLFDVDRCPRTVTGIERFKRRVVRTAAGEITEDKGQRRGPFHAMETAEYAVAHGLPYTRPERYRNEMDDYAARVKKEREHRRLKRRMRHVSPGQSAINLGPRG